MDNGAMGRVPYKVTQDPMVTPLRELVYLPKGVLDPHGLPPVLVESVNVQKKSWSKFKKMKKIAKTKA